MKLYYKIPAKYRQFVFLLFQPTGCKLCIRGRLAAFFGVGALLNTLIALLFVDDKLLIIISGVPLIIAAFAVAWFMSWLKKESAKL